MNNITQLTRAAKDNIKRGHRLVHLARLVSLTGIPTYICEPTHDLDPNRARVIRLGRQPTGMPTTRVRPQSSCADVLFDLHAQALSYDG